MQDTCMVLGFYQAEPSGLTFYMGKMGVCIQSVHVGPPPNFLHLTTTKCAHVQNTVEYVHMLEIGSWP